MQNSSEQQIASAPPDPAYFDALNPEQREAAEILDGPLLVLAGAGTGKTRVLTTRIAHILATRRALPGQILAVTFTNKAAREMGERITSLVGGGVTSADNDRRGMILHWLGTFHSISAKILRRHGELIGFSSNFTILDTDDQTRLIKSLLSQHNIDPKQQPPKLCLAIIQRWKDKGWTPEDVPAGEGIKHMDGLAIGIYREYQRRLKSLNAMDFGDLLLHSLTLFRQHQHILQEYSERFRYILVDEYQDTNIAQYLWLRLLAVGHKNICCVGDDDQSIYGWRGAEVGNILKFEKDFPGAKIVRLERNYRSGGHILAAAAAIISHNRRRLGKTLWTESNQGEKVRVKCLHDSDEEAWFVSEEIEGLQRRGNRFGQMAILVRAGFQTRAFEERFLTTGIAYQVIGGLRFYERQEIRDAIAYLRVISQPDDGLAFERIINLPKRGVGKATLEKIHSAARSANISLYRATEHLLKTGGLGGKVAAALQQLFAQFTKWRALLAQEHDSPPINEFTQRVLEESGYIAMWQENKSPDAPGRIENLRELTRAMGEFERLEDFLEHVALVTDADEVQGKERVSIMTLHAAKGLEFDHVFLPGWEEGLFPHQRSLDEKSRDGLEEERRLAYVGITRARKTLVITHASRRRMFSRGGVEWQPCVPSRFLGELPLEHIEDLGSGLYYSHNHHSSNRNYGASAHKTRNGDWHSEVREIMSAAYETQPAGAASLRPGMRVFHQKFGYGTILSGDGKHLHISFEKAGQKKVLVDYVEIR